ncbi:ABC transporter ATP-binding protein [Pyrofollis japonicus]|uniref:ABC transporter ATP-binding protein n=1 Tax=Pyrofollis japonicus TaxID=3060460 RepID=UPI00295A7059|nr:ATP-binding cassette domain-containing protein [Pyrofollis japonicus]BEP17491.1 ABC transporter ATP-binding protein [Pyrofollis japonicus]
MEHSKLAVRVNNLYKSFGAQIVLAGISIEAYTGEVVAIVGPNGSGKTTLLRIIAGLEEPDKGRVEVNGRALLVFQENLLLPWKKIRDNIALGLYYRKLPSMVIEKRVQEVARLLDLEDHLEKYPWQVSGGTARKAAIARILVLDPDILLLDEPLAGLDVKTRQALLDRIVWIAHTMDKTVILVDHSIETVAAYVDRLYVIGYPPSKVEAEIDLRGIEPRKRLTKVYEALAKTMQE